MRRIPVALAQLAGEPGHEPPDRAHRRATGSPADRIVMPAGWGHRRTCATGSGPARPAAVGISMPSSELRSRTILRMPVDVSQPRLDRVKPSPLARSILLSRIVSAKAIWQRSQCILSRAAPSGVGDGKRVSRLIISASRDRRRRLARSASDRPARTSRSAARRNRRVASTC